MNNSIGTTNNGVYTNDNDRWPEFLESVSNHFNSAMSFRRKLFTTNASGLYEAYLDGIPAEARQHYTCHNCRHFIERIGGLVVINDNGDIESAIWNESTTPDFFKASVANMKAIVLKSVVNGVFIPAFKTLGTPKTGEWTHFSVNVPKDVVYYNRLKTPFQAMAEKSEEFKMLINGLMEFNLETATTALAILESESLYRSEKVLGVGKFFKELHEKRNAVTNSKAKENLVWLAVATAPVGFAHIKSSMIGTLLEDIAEGLSFESVSRRFKEKMNPLQYQRPQVDPTAGNIARAEEIVKKLGIENSLKRRYATVDELETIWKPKVEEKKEASTEGVFGHLTPKGKSESNIMEIPGGKMTWKKFQETVLPNALKIEYEVKHGVDNYGALLTAVDFDAPPILQWDTDAERNPFSWYVYSSGSPMHRWDLTAGYREVTAITLQPSMWYNENLHQGKSVFLILKGAKDTNYRNVGNGLFPEVLKSELREIRSTIEAYSRKEPIQGYEESSACGVRLSKGQEYEAKVRVTTATGVTTYKLDRWD